MTAFDDSITVHYDGKGENIAQHLMDGEQVAKSMKGMVTLYKESFREANKLYKANVESQVLVEGGMEAGSIKWLMRLLTSESDSQIQLGDSLPLHNKVVRAIKETINLIRNIDLSTTDLVIHEHESGYEVEVNGDTVKIDELVCAILTNDKIRKALADMAGPLDNKELDTLTICSTNGNLDTLSIKAEERSKFVVTKRQARIIADGEFDGFYYIDTLSYSPSAKWTLVNRNDPRDTVTGIITDARFLTRVSENKERFAKDDILEVSGNWYKEKTKLTGNTKTTYTITEVRNHFPAGNDQWELK